MNKETNLKLMCGCGKEKAVINCTRETKTEHTITKEIIKLTDKETAKPFSMFGEWYWI